MGRSKELSIIIPGRNETFMRHTVDDVLANTSGDTEVIAVCDGGWPDHGLEEHPRLQVLHFGESVGQRAATNLGAQVSRAKYIMKLDAHCAVEPGFDEALLADMEPDMTMIPSMHRLHVFDWHCDGCGERQYQGKKPEECPECHEKKFSMVMVWRPRFKYDATISWRFDKELHFQYWRKYHKEPSEKRPNPHYARYKEQEPSGLIETMSCIGCCFLMEREQFWKLGGMDEGHGSWGQYGTELACKTWLSGGRMITNTKTWMAHMFRTNNFVGFSGNGSSWPYPITQSQIDAARKYSRDMWLQDKWQPGFAVRPLSWLIEHFKPIPDWHD